MPVAPDTEGGAPDTGFRVPHLLINAMTECKPQILNAAFKAIRQADVKKDYRAMLADSREGRRRVSMVLGLIQKALCGDMQPLLDDQIRTGYIRVIQKVPLHNTLKVHTLMEQTIAREFLKFYSDSSNSEMNYRDLQEDIAVLGQVYDKIKETVSNSYLKTRDEIIERRSKQIEGLYKLRTTLDENSKISSFSQMFIDEVSGILGASHVVLAINKRAGKRFTPSVQVGSSAVALELFVSESMGDILKRMVDIRTPCLVDHNGGKQFPINPESIETIPSGYWLAVPIFTENNFYGFLSINTEKLSGQLFGADSYVILSVVQKIAQAMERNQVLTELRKSQKRLQHLANKVIYAQEEERKKISAEIHDTMIQRLTGIWYKLLYLEDALPDIRKADRELFHSLKTYVNESIMEGRKIVYGLRPLMLDELGVQKTIEEYGKKFRQEHAIEVDVVFKGECSMLSPEKQTSLFRILQEALENIRKHSDSKRARVVLKGSESGVSFAVEDFGTVKARGVSRKSELGKSHFGLIIMEERAKAAAGRLKYGFKKGGGFVVKGNVPCK